MPARRLHFQARLQMGEPQAPPPALWSLPGVAGGRQRGVHSVQRGREKGDRGVAPQEWRWGNGQGQEEGQGVEGA